MTKPTRRLLSACLALLLTAPLVLTACYRSHTITAIPGSGGHVWTGTGRIGELGSQCALMSPVASA